MQVSFRWNSSELHFSLVLGLSLVCETGCLSFTMKTKMYFISHNVPPCGQVLLRRTGIPISLSVLYMTLARKLGVPLEPVNFPNHFLLRWCQNQRRWAFNTFYCSLSEWNYIANTSKFRVKFIVIALFTMHIVTEIMMLVFMISSLLIATFIAVS